MKEESSSVRRRLMLPIWIVHLYLAFTIVLFYFGPFEWKTENPGLLFVYLLFLQGALHMGFSTAMNRPFPEGASLPERDPDAGLVRLLPMMLVVSTIFAVLNATRYLGLKSLDLSLLVARAWAGLVNPAAQYFTSLDGGDFGGPVLPFMSTLLAPVLWSTIPLSLLHFTRLAVGWRLLAAFLILVEAVRWIGMGMNKGVFDLLIVFTIVAFIRRARLTAAQPVRGRRSIRYTRVLLLGAALTIGGLVYFVNAIDSRVGLSNGTGVAWSNISATLGGVAIRQDSLFLVWLPPFLRAPLIYLAAYLTQGYHGLSLALGAPWTPMFGVGHSDFLIHKLGPLLGVDLSQFTYQARIQPLGWDASVNWHTAYVWFANDVSFLGVIPLMFVLGYLAAEAVKDSVIARDSIAAVFLCLLGILFVYLPANDQVLSFPSTFMAFWACLIVWMWRRRKRRARLDFVPRGRRWRISY